MSPNRFPCLVLVALLTAWVGRAAQADEQAVDSPRPEARDYAVAEVLAGLAEYDPGTDPIDTLRSMSIVAGASPQTLVRRVSDDGLWRLRLTEAQHRVFEDLLDGLMRGGPQQVILTAYWLDLPSLEPLNHIDWSAVMRFPDPASIATPAELAELSGGEGASATVTSYVPYLADTIPLGQSVQLLDRAQRDPDIKVLSSPKVTFFNGQHATIQDLSEQPFVVGVTKVVGELATAYQPVIAVFCSGRTLGARSVALASGDIEIDLKLTTTQIEGVEPIKLPGHHALTTQAPRLAKSVVSTKRVLKKGEALLIASSVTPDEKTGRFRCCIVTAKAIQPVKLAAAGNGSTNRLAGR